jgi:hypothetical protein
MQKFLRTSAKGSVQPFEGTTIQKSDKLTQNRFSNTSGIIKPSKRSQLLQA